MSGKIRYWLERDGRYFARLVVPKDLRGISGTTEFRTPLGGDYREAVKLHPGAVADLQHQISLAEQEANQGRRNVPVARYPLAPDQIAHSHYMQRPAFDDVLVNRLRMAIAGSADNDELGALVGAQIKRFQASGNIDTNGSCRL